MNVPDHDAFQLLRAFMRIEYALRQLPDFVAGNPGDPASAQWSAYVAAVLRNDAFIESVSEDARDVLLGTNAGGPPKKMYVNAEGLVGFEDRPLQGPHMADRLVDAARRVRNNLVHGGKERGPQERFPGHDRSLVEAAFELINRAATRHAGVHAFYSD